MNKNAIQKFAVWARTEMIAQVSQRVNTASPKNPTA